MRVNDHSLYRFIDNPNDRNWKKKPLSWIDKRILYISIPFTWNLPDIKSEILQKSFLWDRIIVGGPALSLIPDYFKDIPFVSVGQSMPNILNKYHSWATRTSRGCPHNCKFCYVSLINKKFQEYDTWQDLPIIIDDNLLATSQSHFDRVIDHLIKIGWADFNQGLDIRLLNQYHAEHIKKIRFPIVRLALDSMYLADCWEKGFSILRKVNIAKSHIRCFALVGFDSDPSEAWNRLTWIEKHGVKASPMWFHDYNILKHNVITENQKDLGWDFFERRKLFAWFYFHKKIIKRERIFT